MKIKYLLILLAPVFAMASGGEGGATDIVPRVINFTIFAAILYYLIAEPVKAAYKGRISGIADKLDSIQVKVKESISARESAQAKVDEAKANAQSLIETAKKEAMQLGEKIAKDTTFELQNLEKSFTEKTEIERRKMTRSIVKSVLDEIFNEETMSLDKEELVKIVMKKVA